MSGNAKAGKLWHVMGLWFSTVIISYLLGNSSSHVLGIGCPQGERAWVLSALYTLIILINGITLARRVSKYLQSPE